MAQFYDDVYKIVKQIPVGKVTSYGRVAVMLGKPRAARAVGYALNALKKDSLQDIPWQRVINGQGRISFKGDSIRAKLQKELLLSEGIQFGKDGTVDLKVFVWPQ
ncbi:MGMT family protein [Leptospira sp. GIMC2001]|uniref:MGMT family protein n=1 Tax=Leptospira sp. GIMC2001 TaxID=1513297 RepID=UPI00234B973E|nr:MGMT family protein [Leptospira sp. GIMC2001]WCL48810.1 MGMT family protein [Leptospira sp. GIMC2001]